MKLSKSFFLKNTGVRQTIFKNTFWLTVAEVVTQFLKLVLVVYTARILGAEGYGKFSFALSFVSLLVMFAELGLPDIITREFSREKLAEKEYPSIISFKVFLSVATFLLISIGSLLITKEAVIRQSILLLAVFILITSFLNIFYAFFRARQKMEYESAFRITQYGLLTALSFVVLFTFPSVNGLSLAYLIANMLAMAMMAFFFHRFIMPLKISYDMRVWRKFANFSWPLILGVSIGWIYVPTSSVLLGYFGLNTENGWYSAAYKIIGVAVLSATLISRSFFPALATASKEGKERVQKIWNYQKELMMLFALPLVAGAAALAPKIILFFYGASFTPSIAAFRWLALVFAIDFLYYPYACALIIFGHEKKGFWVVMAGLGINIVLNIIVIPQYALSGVIISNIVSSAVAFSLAVFLMVRYTPLSPFNLKLLKTFLIAACSSALMFFITTSPLVYRNNLFVLMAIGMAVYFGAFGAGYWCFNKGMRQKVKEIITYLR